MKILNLILVACTCLTFSHAQAQKAGGISSNGGDGIVSEFFDIARILQKAIAKQNNKSVAADRFAKTIATAKIYSQEKVYLGDKEVSAINTPALQEIQVSRMRWKALASTPKLKYVLVLHEFLGLMGYEDRTFNISNQVIEELKIEIPKDPAATLDCPKKNTEMARCNLGFILIPGEEPSIPPSPVEAILCSKDRSADQVDLYFKLTGFEPNLVNFKKDQDQYLSVNQKEVVHLKIDHEKKQILLKELWLGYQTTSVYSCLIW